MTITRLVAPFERARRVAHFVESRGVVVSFVDVDTVLAVASMREWLDAPLGVWLEISEDYSAQLCARDVATLSWLVRLDSVVVSYPHEATEHADVVRALLTDDEVNFSNRVATVVGAYNRPAPPYPLAVWSWDGTHLRGEHEALTIRSNAVDEAGEVSTFA